MHILFFSPCFFSPLSYYLLYSGLGIHHDFLIHDCVYNFFLMSVPFGVLQNPLMLRGSENERRKQDHGCDVPVIPKVTRW